MGSVIVRLIWLYDTSMTHCFDRQRVSLDVATFHYIFLSISALLARSTIPVSEYGVRIAALVITGLAIAMV